MLFVALLFQEFAAGEAKPSQPKTASERDGSIRAAVAVLILLFVLCGGGIVWCFYLECGPSVPRTRLIMYVVLGLSTVTEIGCCFQDVFRWWAGVLVLFINFWGPFDAILRFPSVHGMDLFTTKQLSLLVVKAFTYCMGLTTFGPNKMVFFGLMVFNVVGMPLMYVLALPLDEATPEQVAAACALTDVDILLRLMTLVTDPRERRELIVLCKTRARRAVANAARASPAAVQSLLCKMDPQMGKMLQKTGRDV